MAADFSTEPIGGPDKAPKATHVDEPAPVLTRAWFDANGHQVTHGPELRVFDDNGHLWTIDRETGQLGAVELRQAGIYPSMLLWADPDCSDPFLSVWGMWDDAPVFEVPAPRVMLEAPEVFGPGRYFTRADHEGLVCARYRSNGGECFDLDESYGCLLGLVIEGGHLILEKASPALSVPVLGPLHLREVMQ